MTVTLNDTLWLRFTSIELALMLGGVLNGTGLTIRQGEVVTLIGPSGAGKSTVLRCINALEDTDDGLIQVGGGPIGVKLERGRVIRRRDKGHPSPARGHWDAHVASALRRTDE